MVRPGILTTSTNNSTHSKRFEPITQPVDLRPKCEASWSRVAISDFAFGSEFLLGKIRRSLAPGLPGHPRLFGECSVKLGVYPSARILPGLRLKTVGPHRRCDKMISRAP